MAQTQTREILLVMKKNRRIFIGPHEIAGYYSNLTEGMKRIQVDCDYATLSPDPRGYGGENKTPFLLKLARWFNRFRGKPNRSIILRVIMAIPGELFALLWGITAIFNYDIFIFGFGHSLFRNNLDLPLIRLLGKRAIMNMAHGAELRPPYIDGAYQSPDGNLQPTPDRLFVTTTHHLRRIRFLERYTYCIIGAPFSSTQFSAKMLVNLFAIGLPSNFSEPKVSGASHYTIPNSTAEHDDHQASDSKRPTRILHSPSHPAVKGSDVIIQAIDNLISKGHRIEFVQLHNRPNSDVIKEIQRCDFVVDQVYSDTPLAGFATEAAWFGKPAVVGGYGFEYLKRFIPDGMAPPSKTCHPDEIEAAIEELILNIDMRKHLGRQAQEFVRTKWSAEQVAKRYLRIIEDDVPHEWWLDPGSVIYVHGAGQSAEQTRKNIRHLVSKHGVGALQLSHRPELEKAFLEFAGLEM